MIAQNKKWLLLSFVLLFGFVYALTYLPLANEGPRGIHQWAQGDRIAICLRYIEGKALTDPATLSMKSEDGNVGVEFSGFQYVIAQCIRLGLPQQYLYLFYRLLTFSLFYTSLFVLFYTVLKPEKWLSKAFLFLGIISSPLLLYYGYNFLPDVLALALLFWCFYFVYSNFHENIFKILLISGLAMLIKTSSGIYFIAFMATYFLLNARHWNKKLTLSILLFLVLGSLVAAYDYYFINQRNEEFHSYVFLSATMPVHTWGEFVQVFDTAKRFTSEYFNGAQRSVLGLLLLVAIFNIKKIRVSSMHFILSVITSLGLLAFLVLFGVQYMNHDYYVIATFIPIVIYLFIRGLKYITDYVHPKTVMVLSILFGLVSFSQGNKRYFNRMSETVWINNYPEYYEHQWMVGAEGKIQPFVKKDDFVFSVYSVEPNTPLVYFNRKGATFNDEEMKREDSPFTWFLKFIDTKYVVCYTKYVPTFATDHPDFVANAKVLYTDDKLTLYEKNGH